MAPRKSQAVPAFAAAGLAGFAAFGSSSAFITAPSNIVAVPSASQAAAQQSSNAESTSAPSQVAGAAAVLVTAGLVTRLGLTGRQHVSRQQDGLTTMRNLGKGEEGRGSGVGYYNLLPEWEKPASGFEGTIGDQEPLGFWDPAGFTADGNVEKFKKRREVELKHGRVAMFATIGYIVPEYFKFPGYCSTSLNLKFADIPNGLKALSVVPKEGWAQIVAFAGFLELVVNKPTGEPGNYSKGFLGLGYLGLGSSVQNPDARAKKLRAELSNGRLAMFAIIGMFFQDGLTGSAWGDWSLYTDSPLRAFENETGAQPPVGFWDPLGLAASGSNFDFKRRREVELKHGRVAMFATIGYILPEYWRFPGDLSTYNGIKFTDVPNGLAAISKVPYLGWLQIVGFAGLIEVNVYNENVNGEPGNYGAGFLGLRTVGIMNTGFKDAEVRKKKLNAELANGRLAMMAIIGMFFQDGLTGSAWGDWANYTESPLRAFEGELGVQAPVGFWDPVGYCRDGNVETFKRRRETEIKHGRVAMYATIGYITPEYFKWPGYLSPSLGLKFEDVPNGLAAFSKVPGNGWAQIVAFAGYYELFVYKFNGTPGDYGWKVITSADPEAKKRKLNAELANGRLAMMAIIGMFFQDGLTGSAWGDWANYAESPLRAFEGELGVQAPVGFWDPVRYCRDGNVETFKRRRETEIKHGRVAMYATIGYITPEYFKWPGYLSPSLGLKFEDVPNGLAAFSKVPGNGWAQIVAFAGYYELFVYKFNGTPGDYGWKVITSADPEAKKRKLNAELANGRLAMMAIIGMFFQDGLTGSAWGDWSLYTDSPLRSLGMGEEGRGSGVGYYNLLPEWEKPASGFEGTIGDQEPLGFWDPAGFTADGSVEKFKRRREVELKHGRVAMFATIGYIVPEYFKFPGYCSTSLNLKFADIPNGLKALAVVPKEGWAQILAFAGFLELVVNKPTGEPGNYSKGFLGLGYLGLGSSVQNPDVRAKKLRSELSNGRLAMFAIIGMFFQDGLTGSAWGDWSLYTDSPLRAFENETGAQPPVGFWDPLGLAASGSNFDFKRRREVELKHGRVAMFATIGYILPEYWRFPGDLSTYQGIKFTDVPNGLAAISKVPYLGWLQIVGFAGLIEVNVYNENINGEPGNYGAGFLGLRTVGIMNTGFKDAEVRKKKLNAELANGRLAMMAIIGMFFQDGLTGSAWGDWANYTESPLRAFEGELGVQAPVGFWDPVGYCRDGNVETFERRRETEIKHGRVAMYATIGYIMPEYFKWPGYLSPSLGLKFEDVPNGLAAFSKVPGNGWAQIVAFAGYYELFVYKYSGTPGAYGWKVITSADPEGLKRKLNAELANGRLAMMAIIGMFFQDGLTGSAWGDWSLYTDSPLR